MKKSMLLLMLTAMTLLAGCSGGEVNQSETLNTKKPVATESVSNKKVKQSNSNSTASKATETKYTYQAYPISNCVVKSVDQQTGMAFIQLKCDSCGKLGGNFTVNVGDANISTVCNGCKESVKIQCTVERTAVN